MGKATTKHGQQQKGAGGSSAFAAELAAARIEAERKDLERLLASAKTSKEKKAIRFEATTRIKEAEARLAKAGGSLVGLGASVAAVVPGAGSSTPAPAAARAGRFGAGEAAAAPAPSSSRSSAAASMMDALFEVEAGVEVAEAAARERARSAAASASKTPRGAAGAVGQFAALAADPAFSGTGVFGMLQQHLLSSQSEGAAGGNGSGGGGGGGGGSGRGKGVEGKSRSGAGGTGVGGGVGRPGGKR